MLPLIISNIMVLSLVLFFWLLFQKTKSRNPENE